MFIKSLAKSLATTIGLVPDREEKESLTKTELRKFWYHNSFSKYLPYGLYDKELGVYYNLDGTVGIFFECVPLLFSSEATLSSLQSTLKSAFPEGSILQFICYADPNVDPFLNAYLENKTNPKVPSFIRKAYESLVEYYKSGINFGAPVRNFRVFVALKFPLKNASESFIKETKSSLRESLVASKLFPVDVVPEVFVSTMRRLFNDNVSPEVEYLWTNYTFLKNQIIFSETEIERSGKILRIGNKFFRSLSPKTLPNKASFFFANYITGSYDGVPGDISQITSPFFITFTIILEDQKMNIHSKANMVLLQQPIGSFVLSINRKKEEFMLAVDEMERGEKFYPCFISLWIYDTDKDKLESSVYKAKKIWEALGCTMQEESFIMLPLFFYSLPFGFVNDVKTLNFIDRHFVLPTRTISAILPTQTDYAGTREPNLLFLGRKGQIVGLNLFSPESSNYNFLIVAPSGKGKSFTGNYILTNILGAGVKVRVIDIGASYKKLCNMFGGRFIDFHPEADICINFFELVRDLEYDIPVITQILAHMTAVHTGQLPGKISVESAVNIIRAAVQSVLRRKGNSATLDDVYEYLSTFPKYFDDYDLLCGEDKPHCEEDFSLVASHLAFNLYKYTSYGQYGKWFVGPNTFDLSKDDFVVIELEHLKALKDLFGVITLVVLYTSMQDLYLSDKRTPRMILLDEAWQFLQDTKAFQELIEEGYRRARKYYGSFGIITQSILDFEHFGRVGQVILSNAAFKFFLESSDLAIAKDKKLLPVDDEFTFRLLNSVRYNAPKYSEVFLVSDRFGYGVLRLTVDPYSYFIYTSNPREVSEIETMVKSGMNYEEAIEEMIKRYRS